MSYIRLAALLSLISISVYSRTGINLPAPNDLKREADLVQSSVLPQPKPAAADAIRIFASELTENGNAYSASDVVVSCSGIDDTANLSAAIAVAGDAWVVIESGSICASSDLTKGECQES